MNRVILAVSLLACGAFSLHPSSSVAGDSFKPLKTHHSHGKSGGQADAYAHPKTASHRRSPSQTASSTCRKTGAAEGLKDAALRTFVSDCMKQQSQQSSMSSDTASPS
jgi:hypothetical protein